jgi:putative glutamine amidotransferase
MFFFLNLIGLKKQGSGWIRHKPAIGISGPHRGAWPARLCLRILVWWNGGVAVQLTPLTPAGSKELDGLILMGGSDIHPSRYKEQLIDTIKHESQQVRRWNKRLIFSIFIWILRKLFSIRSPLTAEESRSRDELEFDLLTQAVNKNIPILGICRGAQLINVFFGGSLYQDIKPFYTEEPELHTILPRQRVFIDPDSRLYEIFRRSFIQVNSLHLQSVNRLGAGLKATAKDPSGIIEAVEHTQLSFVIGVQWHPEFLLLHESQRRLFENFVSKARLSLDNHLMRPAHEGS